MAAPSGFRPKNWYWIVAGSTTQVYSSASGTYVPVNDPTYLAWLNPEIGNVPRAIASEAALGQELALFSLRPQASAANVLDAYADSHATRLTAEVAAKLFFNIVNEIRVLKGQSTLTAQQFKAYVKGLM
jgi:hypothetical protein